MKITKHHTQSERAIHLMIKSSMLCLTKENCACTFPRSRKTDLHKMLNVVSPFFDVRPKSLKRHQLRMYHVDVVTRILCQKIRLSCTEFKPIACNTINHSRNLSNCFRLRRKKVEMKSFNLDRVKRTAFPSMQRSAPFNWNFKPI